jgi:hypothetical protein
MTTSKGPIQGRSTAGQFGNAYPTTMGSVHELEAVKTKQSRASYQNGGDNGGAWEFSHVAHAYPAATRAATEPPAPATSKELVLARPADRLPQVAEGYYSPARSSTGRTAGPAIGAHFGPRPASTGGTSTPRPSRERGPFTPKSWFQGTNRPGFSAATPVPSTSGRQTVGKAPEPGSFRHAAATYLYHKAGGQMSPQQFGHAEPSSKPPSSNGLARGLGEASAARKLSTELG